MYKKITNKLSFYFALVVLILNNNSTYGQSISFVLNPNGTTP